MAKQQAADKTPPREPERKPPQTPIGDDPRDRNPDKKLPGKPSDPPAGEDMAGEGTPGLTLTGGGGHA